MQPQQALPRALSGCAVQGMRRAGFVARSAVHEHDDARLERLHLFLLEGGQVVTQRAQLGVGDARRTQEGNGWCGAHAILLVNPGGGGVLPYVTLYRAGWLGHAAKRPRRNPQKSTTVPALL